MSTPPASGRHGVGVLVDRVLVERVDLELVRGGRLGLRLLTPAFTPKQ